MPSHERGQHERVQDRSPENNTRRDWIQEVIVEYENGLLHYAQHFVRDSERARDIVQDTFLQLCRQPEDKWDSGSSHLRRWLFKVCRNRAIDICRKERRMKLTPNDRLADQLTAPEHNSHPDRSGPEAAALAREEGAAIDDQISRLTENQQEVIRLKFHGQLSYKEIAQVTGLTATNVGFLLHTALQKLRHRVAATDH